VAALGIELPPQLLALLDHLAASLDATLGTRLDKAYPPDTASSPTLERSAS
jgi:membrane protein